MASCLGISTESNIIKYAKVSTERNSYHVDSYGVKFADKDRFEEAIRQIVEETQSTNIPININLENEMYNKFEVFNGLKKKDVEAILDSEFEILCDDKNYNFQALTSRYLLTEDPMNKEKNVALYVSADKADILSKTNRLSNNRISGLLPLPLLFQNIIEAKKENYAIINIEDHTTMTTVVNGSISDVHSFETGMRQILEAISRKENSYARAYDSCKNTTIYTMDVAESQMAGNEYLENIMPILYDIVTQIKEVTDNSFVSMQKIYLTGTVTTINNVELYFQEYFPGAKCEILTPSFVATNNNINIKEYVEVNSAIALAVYGLLNPNENINFKSNSGGGNNVWEQLKNLATKDIQFGKGNSNGSGLNLSSLKIDWSLKGSLDRAEKDMVRVIGAFGVVIIVFGIISFIISQLINTKINEVDSVISSTNTVIATVTSDTTKTKAKTAEYNERIKKLEQLNNQIKTDYKMKRAIPNLLNQIMAVIPREVQITAIQNTSNNKILIKAQAERYEELGYFGAVLKNQGILLDVQTSAGTRENNLVKIDIEGNLP